jgi:hypothetical protein
MPNRGGFSWKRATGVTRTKQRIARQTGIPLTKSGRQRKVGKAVTGGGCLLPALIAAILAIGATAAGCTSSGGAQNLLEATPRATDEPTADPISTLAVEPASTPKPARPKPTKRPATVYYKNCTAARAAGAAPIYRGEPGYRAGLDRDNDGIACE